jgi:hypothetical protein
VLSNTSGAAGWAARQKLSSYHSCIHRHSSRVQLPPGIGPNDKDGGGATVASGGDELEAPARLEE